MNTKFKTGISGDIYLQKYDNCYSKEENLKNNENEKINKEQLKNKLELIDLI
jgi:hypothetical protein